MPRAADTEMCPKCARPRAPEAFACPSCGVIYARFRARPPIAPLVAPKARSRSIPIAAASLEALLSFVARSVESGVPLASLASTGALATLPRRAAEKLDADLRAGVPLSQSLDELQALDSGSRALVRAGELHAGLPEALRAVAARLAHRQKVRVGLLLAVAYPALLVLGAAVVLPLPIAFREGMVAYLGRVVPLVLAMVAVAIVTLVVAPRLAPASPLRRGPRWLAQRVPVGRSAALHGALATFAGVLGACVNAGVPVRKAVVLAAEGAAPHPAFEGAPERLLEELDRGATLAEVLGVIRSMPTTFVAQVGTAEISGTLGSVLPALEDEHEKKARFLWMTFAAIVGASVFAGVLVVIAFQVVSGWIEVFKTQAQQIDKLTR
jgi:type II secretory pathway component PulF